LILVIFDPFAGFGTTLICAEKLGRRAYGIEYLKERTNSFLLIDLSKKIL